MGTVLSCCSLRLAWQYQMELLVARICRERGADETGHLFRHLRCAGAQAAGVVLCKKYEVDPMCCQVTYRCGTTRDGFLVCAVRMAKDPNTKIEFAFGLFPTTLIGFGFTDCRPVATCELPGTTWLMMDLQDKVAN